eukprot:gene7454-11779_t
MKKLNLTQEERKEYYKRYNAEYYQRNKERMQAQMLQPVFCPHCHIDVAKCRYARHCNSMRHQRNEQNNQNVENIELV